MQDVSYIGLNLVKARELLLKNVNAAMASQELKTIS